MEYLNENIIDEIIKPKPLPDFKSFVYNHYRRKFPRNIDIEAEYELIQNKKSKLSKSQRDAVEFCFNFDRRKKN